MTAAREQDAKEPKLERLSNAGGESACWAHLLCPECGAVLDGAGHAEGCSIGENHKPQRFPPADR